TLLRNLTGACSRDRREEHRPGADFDAAWFDSRQGSGNWTNQAVPAERKNCASRRVAVALGIYGADDRRCRQRLDVARWRSECHDPRGESLRLPGKKGVTFCECGDRPHKRGIVMPDAVGFYTDTTVCIGCKACQVACHQWNDLPAERGPSKHGLPVLS